MKIELDKYVYFDPITRISFAIKEETETGYNILLKTGVNGYISKLDIDKYIYLDDDSIIRMNVANNLLKKGS